MPPSSSLSMTNEESVLVDRRFGVHSGGLSPSDSQSLTYRQQRIVAEQKQDQSHFMSSKAPSSPNPNISAGSTSRQVQYTFQSSPLETAPTVATPRVVGGVGAVPSPSPSPVPELSRLAQRRYARAVQYANFRNAHGNTANSSHSVASSVTSNSSMPGSLPPSASPKPIILTNTNTTTRPLKPPSHSASPRVPPPRIKDQSPAPITPRPAQPTTPTKLPPRPPTPPRTKPPSSAGSVTSTSNTTIASTTDHSFAQSSADALEWRKHGKRVRAMLLLEDEEKGGSYFDLTNSCPIERYYRVAERVLEKFLSTSIRNNVNEMELAESYLVGNRLVKFLSIVLPTHQQYFSNDPQLQLLRKRSQEQLVHLLRYLEEIALVMDELQYNHYILRDLTPEEQSLVNGLMTPGRNGDKDPIVGGNGGGNGTSPRATTPIDVSMDSTGSAMSTQTIRTSSAPSTPLATTSSTTTPRTVSPDVMRMDRATRSPAPSTKTTTTTTPPKTWSDCKGSLQERITQVIQMTESFSDTYESTIEGKPEAAPHLILKRTLMAAAATEGGGGAAVKETTTTSPPNRRSSTPTPSVRQTNRMTPIQQPKQRTISPTFSENSDPSLQTLSSEESHEANHPIQHQQAQHHGQNSGWNEREGQFILDWDDDEFRADGKANNPWNQNATPNNNFKNKTDSGIPKLKQPKARPTRSERARAAAAMQYDQLFTQSQPTFKYSNGTRGLHEATYSQKQQSMEKNNNNKNVPRPPPSDAGMKESSHAIKTKIEVRLERASVIQQELRQHELRKRQNHSTSQRWRTRLSEDRTPLKADDYGDGDNSILQDQPKEVMTNQSILRHFRGCVQCMLD